MFLSVLLTVCGGSVTSYQGTIMINEYEQLMYSE